MAKLQQLPSVDLDALNAEIGRLADLANSGEAAAIDIRELTMRARWVGLIALRQRDHLDFLKRVRQDLEDRLTKFRGRMLASLAETSDQNALNPHGFHVYIFWSDRREVLYVGQSQNIFRRLGDHMGDARKHAKVRRIQLFRCRTRTEMTQLERQLIAEYQPPWNTVGVIRPRPKS